LVAAAKFLVAVTKKLSVIPNSVAVTRPFFSVQQHAADEFPEEGLKLNNAVVDHRNY